ncbi:MAG: SEC-C domain-containing protein, partial [Tidjanibacter sp.]|nr:SEC-C domain-containing protein [Tidjanibacter sp.]
VESEGAEIYKMFTKLAMLTTIDDNWREHLRAMDDLKQSVQNASYEQKDPLLIYKLEAYNLFRAMIDKINREVLSILLKGYIPTRENAQDRLRQRQQNQQKVDVNKLQASRMAAAAAAGQGEKSRPMPVHVEKKVRPNDPCPCGSGKKYKHCHGA